MTARMITRWTLRIIAAGLFLFGLPFYLGYGNPLPFLSPDYSGYQNAWLCAFPLILLGFIIGWFYELAGGLLIVVSIALAQIVTILTYHEIVPHMLVPMAVGIGYLILCWSDRHSQPLSS